VLKTDEKRVGGVPKWCPASVGPVPGGARWPRSPDCARGMSALPGYTPLQFAPETVPQSKE